MTANILKKVDSYTFHYPAAIKGVEQQIDVRWTADEILVEKDLYDIHNNLTEAELHGVITTLTAFTKYELKVGADFWLSRMMRVYKRPELQRMFAEFGNTELNTHAPFYAKINELLGLNTDEFYMSYLDHPVLVDRMTCIDDAVGLKLTDELDILKSVGAFSIVEGAILYSNFAFLKHFQGDGKNKLANIVAGIDFSVRDENLHSEGGAWLFNTTADELELNTKQQKEVGKYIQDFAKIVYEHECQIIDMIFEKGVIPGITDVQLKNFVASRIDLCLSNLNLPPIYGVAYNPIGKWFYKSLQSGKLHDFFFTQGNSYRRDWNKKRFTWSTS